MSHFVGSRGSNIKAVLQELHLVSWNKCGDRFFSPIISYYQLINAFWVFQLNSNMTIEQKGDSSFQLLYPEDMEENDLEEATHIVSINK